MSVLWGRGGWYYMCVATAVISFVLVFGCNGSGPLVPTSKVL